MPSIYYDSDVSGSGSAILGGSQIIFVSADIVTPSPAGTRLVDADEWLRQGWWVLGDSFDVGLGTFEYWHEKHFLNFDHNVYSPDPSTDNGTSSFLTLVATRIRWQIAPFGLAHLHVLGA